MATDVSVMVTETVPNVLGRGVMVKVRLAVPAAEKTRPDKGRMVASLVVIERVTVPALPVMGSSVMSNGSVRGTFSMTRLYPNGNPPLVKPGGTDGTTGTAFAALANARMPSAIRARSRMRDERRFFINGFT